MDLNNLGFLQFVIFLPNSGTEAIGNIARIEFVLCKPVSVNSLLL